MHGIHFKLQLMTALLLCTSAPPPPGNFTLSPLSDDPSALCVTWSPPQASFNFTIINYWIYCNATLTLLYPEQVVGPNLHTTTVNATILAVTMTGLKAFTQYDCYVTANTSVGEGIPSAFLTARTAEGGKSLCISPEVLAM